MWPFLRLHGGSDRVRSAWRDSLVRGPRPLVRALGLAATPGRAEKRYSPAPRQLPLPRERESHPSLPNLFLSLDPKRDRAEAPGAPAPTQGSWDARPSLGKGARWGGGYLGREGRSCKSVAGGRLGKISASQMSAPDCS